MLKDFLLSRSRNLLPPIVSSFFSSFLIFGSSFIAKFLFSSMSCNATIQRFSFFVFCLAIDDAPSLVKWEKIYCIIASWRRKWGREWRAGRGKNASCADCLINVGEWRNGSVKKKMKNWNKGAKERVRWGSSRLFRQLYFAVLSHRVKLYFLHFETAADAFLSVCRFFPFVRSSPFVWRSKMSPVSSKFWGTRFRPRFS